LLVVAVWLKVSRDEQRSRDQFREEQNERIQRDVAESVRRSMDEQKKR
jgi:hypothetical protein